MATRPALQDLQVFNQNPTSQNASRLVTIPVLYNLLKHEEKQHSHYWKAVTQLCAWVYNRGIEVLKKLLIYEPPSKLELRHEEIGWEIVSGRWFVSKL
jgi:hypothetical protein